MSSSDLVAVDFWVASDAAADEDSIRAIVFRIVSSNESAGLDFDFDLDLDFEGDLDWEVDDSATVVVVWSFAREFSGLLDLD